MSHFADLLGPGTGPAPSAALVSAAKFLHIVAEARRACWFDGSLAIAANCSHSSACFRHSSDVTMRPVDQRSGSAANLPAAGARKWPEPAMPKRKRPAMPPQCAMCKIAHPPQNALGVRCAMVPEAPASGRFGRGIQASRQPSLSNQRQTPIAARTYTSRR